MLLSVWYRVDNCRGRRRSLDETHEAMAFDELPALGYVYESSTRCLRSCSPESEVTCLTRFPLPYLSDDVSSFIISHILCGRRSELDEGEGI